jgi:GT2 family glycosyltransferase
VTDLDVSTGRTAPRAVVASLGRHDVVLSDDGSLLVVAAADGSVDPAAASAVRLSLARLLGRLAGLEAPDRAAAMATLVAAAADDPAAAEGLVQARQALRERHLPTVISPTDPGGVQIEAFAMVDERTWFIQGWIGRPDEELRRVSVLSALGHRVDITATMVRHPRPDVDEFYRRVPEPRPGGAGFVALVELPHACPVDGFLVEVESIGGPTVEAACPSALTDAAAVRDLLLARLRLDRQGEERITRAVVHPAIQALEDRRRRHVALDTVDRFGARPDDAQVSVVVPLYGRLDFLEHQLAQWVLDPAMRETDLIYLLDQPEHTDTFRAEAMRLARLYDVPFTLATVTQNAGFSGANNLAAELAVGRLLLMCNSDVLPDRPGWLPALTRTFDSIPAIGALAPRLLFEDSSLQHAGMYFDRPAGESAWTNEHYFKGLRGDLAAASVTREVPAVTGACMLVDRSMFRALGGLRDRFVQGDFEDSDLCLRLRQEGRSSWYAADVQLFHLEAMSYPSELRGMVSSYNRWLHTELWDREIGEAMADPRVAPDHDPSAG